MSCPISQTVHRSIDLSIATSNWAQIMNRKKKENKKKNNKPTTTTKNENVLITQGLLFSANESLRYLSIFTMLFRFNSIVYKNYSIVFVSRNSMILHLVQRTFIILFYLYVNSEQKTKWNKKKNGWKFRKKKKQNTKWNVENKRNSYYQFKCTGCLCLLWIIYFYIEIQLI